jgi:hypothetical protein
MYTCKKRSDRSKKLLEHSYKLRVLRKRGRSTGRREGFSGFFSYSGKILQKGKGG